MISLQECKQYVALHAKTLNIGREVNHLIKKIDDMSDLSPNGWAPVFFNEAEKRKEQGEIDKALGFYNIARFPFPYTELQKKSYEEYVLLFNKKFVLEGDLKVKSILGGRAEFYYKKGYTNEVVIICGGIISLKEQWVRALKLINKLGPSVVLTEMPGVGGNTIPLNGSCFDFFTRILNELKVSDKSKCHLLAMSFSGYIALKNSSIDSRISSITMVGTPVFSIYHESEYFKHLPDITKSILIHNINKSNMGLKNNHDLFKFLDENFSSFDFIRHDLNIFYLQSKYDEVIPSDEMLYLESKCSNFNYLSLPDVHGSPNFHKSVVLFVIWSVLKSMGRKVFIRGLIKTGICFFNITHFIKNFMIKGIYQR